jgi:hypothetical protein
MQPLILSVGCNQAAGADMNREDFGPHLSDILLLGFDQEDA